MSELLRHMSTTLDRIMALLEAKDEREQAAVRLHAVARGQMCNSSYHYYG